jgi:homoserine dehydrogenase
MDETSSQYYILLEVRDRPGVLAQVAQAFADNNVSIMSMRQEGMGHEARLVMVSHHALERDFQALLGDLRHLDVVEDVASAMRVISAEE